MDVHSHPHTLVTFCCCLLSVAIICTRGGGRSRDRGVSMTGAIKEAESVCARWRPEERELRHQAMTHIIGLSIRLVIDFPIAVQTGEYPAGEMCCLKTAGGYSDFFVL